MNGAVAAGHPLTAQAGARILAEGGNAVDACIAAGAVSWVSESPLTGPGAGGFMLVHRARDRSDRVLDFFVTIPGRGLDRNGDAQMEEVLVPFAKRTLQLFRIGAASCAVPGAVAGLGEAHRLFARLPWSELLAPAIEVAREGVPLNRQQAFLHSILDVALRARPEGREIYGSRRPLATGEEVVMRDLAEGGRIPEEDLASYRVIRRRPVRASYRGHTFVTNPPPSAGGLLIAFALRVLDRLGSSARPGSAQAIAVLAGGMREATNARG